MANYRRDVIGNVEVGGKVTIKDISMHKYDNVNGKTWWEMHTHIHIKSIWSNDIEINHESKLRHILNDDEVKQLQEKGLIKINVK